MNVHKQRKSSSGKRSVKKLRLPRNISMRTIVALYILLIVVAAIMAVITALSLKSQPSATPQPENPFQNGQVENIAFTLYYPS